jgi:KipI family sensor histidine kinase inhibitor
VSAGETFVGADGLTWRLTRLGPAALRLSADAPPSASLSARLAAVREVAWSQRSPSLRDLVVGYRTLTAEVRLGASATLTAATLRAATTASCHHEPVGRELELPVFYGHQADRHELERLLGLPWERIVALHRGADYRVAFIGFTPGFAYLHGLPIDLGLPRRLSPTPMAAGAVAIADGRAGIYPAAGPGGWWSLGTTPTPLFDPWRPDPTTLLPGDRVRFVPSAGEPYQRPHIAPSGSAALEVALEVLEVWKGGVTLQGRPRANVGHLGMAQAGALDARAFHAAARLAGSPLDLPALELAIPHATLRATQPLVAAASGGGARLHLDGRHIPLGRTFVWPAGTTLEVRPDPKVGGSLAVLAVGGGLTPSHGPVGHPELVGHGSTDVRAGVGGFGRALRAGDLLAIAGSARPPDRAWAGRRRLGRRVTLRLHRGHRNEGEAFAALLRTRFLLSARDRMGARLDGATVPPARPDIVSEGVPLGAVQLPADGRPIVLLADRGRTGGYALAGIVDPRDIPDLVQAPAGSEVVFIAADT